MAPQKSASGLLRNASGGLMESRMGSISRDATASRKKLIDEGLQSLLGNLMKDLTAPELSRQVRALHALQALTKSKAGSDGVQNAFREAGGIQCLVAIMGGSQEATEEGTEEHVAKCKAVEGFFFLCRNNAESRGVAIEAGAVTALNGLLDTAGNLPHSIYVIRALSCVISPDTSGAATAELHTAGGIESLVLLLKLLLEAEAGQEGREVWIQEVVALLEPAARQSRAVAHYLAAEIGTICRLILTSLEPLSISLGLEILEEVVACGRDQVDLRKLASQRAVAALIHAVGLKGFGGKAAMVLGKLVAGDAVLLALLHALLQPADIAALVRTAARGAKAEDIDAAVPAKLVAELLQQEVGSSGRVSQERGASGGHPPVILKSVVLSSCVGACLSMQHVRAALLQAASNPLGMMVLRNLPARYMTEVAIAAAQLLPELPTTATLLEQADAVPCLVAAFLEEHAAADIDTMAGLEATAGVSNVLRAFPMEAETPEEDHCPQAPPSPRTPNGTSTTDSSFGSITFHVAGHEFVALGWLLEQASPAIARTLKAIPDASSAAVVIPEVPGIPPDQLYRLFGVAVEFASSGNLALDGREALDLWALAAVLQMEKLQARCERLAADSLLQNPANMQQALEFVQQYPNASENLCRLCCRHLAESLLGGAEVGHPSQQIQSLVPTCRDALQVGFEDVLTSCLRSRYRKLKTRLDGGGQAACHWLEDERHCRTAEAGNSSRLASPLSKAQSLVATSSFHDWIPEDRDSESGRPRSRIGSPDDTARSLTFPGLSRLGHVTETIEENESA